MTVAEEQPVSPTTASAISAEMPEFDLVIEKRRGWIGLDVKEMLRFRELLFFLIWRDVKVRYKQTVLGVAWAILQPIFNVILFTWVFGKMAGFDKRLPPGLPFSVFVYAAMLPWMLISTGISMGGMSLLNAQNMISKVYLPRLFIPAATVGGALVDMALSMIVFVVMILYTHTAVHWTVIFILPLIFLTVLLALGFSILLSALTVTYRDVRFLMPFMTTVLMYSGAIMFPTNTWSARAHLILSINPVY